MKKVTSLILLVSMLFLSSCVSHKDIGGKNYECYGFFNETTVKNQKIIYQVSPWNLIIGIIFFETVVVPVYIIGYQLFEPVDIK